MTNRKRLGWLLAGTHTILLLWSDDVAALEGRTAFVTRTPL